MQFLNFLTVRVAILLACLLPLASCHPVMEKQMVNVTLQARRIAPMPTFRQGLCRLHGQEKVQVLSEQIPMIPQQRAQNYLYYKGEYGHPGQEPASFKVWVENKVVAVEFDYPTNMAPLPSSYMVSLIFKPEVAAKDIGDNGWWFDTKKGYITTCHVDWTHTIGAIQGVTIAVHSSY